MTVVYKYVARNFGK